MKLSNIVNREEKMEKVLKNNTGVTLVGLMLSVFLMIFAMGLSMSTGLWQQIMGVADSVSFAQVQEEIEMEIVCLEMDYFLDYEENRGNFKAPLEYVRNELKKGIVTSTGAALSADETGKLMYQNKEGFVAYAHLDEVGNITYQGKEESDKAREELIATIME